MGTSSSIRPLAVILTAGVVLAGCQSSRLGALQTQPTPAPITAAPAGTVTSGQLPPPVKPDAAVQTPAPTTTPVPTEGEFPTAPENTQVAAAPVPEKPATPSVQPVATSGPVTKEALVGAWKVSTGGSSCQMFMALTKWSGGFRAAARGCPGDAASVSSWNVSGNQVVLSDSSGNKVASLFSNGSGGYSGQTSGGSQISFSR